MATLTGSNVQSTPSGGFPISGTQSSMSTAMHSGDAPSSLDFASRTTTYVNGLPQMGYNIFSFHNSMKDMLTSGVMQGYDMTNINSFINTLPSDWKSKYLSSEEGMSNLFSHVNELANIAQALWQQGSQSTIESGWYTSDYSLSTQQGPGDWNKQAVDPHAQHCADSEAKNQGTYKEGYADSPDHPDYVANIGEIYAGYKDVSWYYNKNIAGQSEAAEVGEMGEAAEAGEAMEGIEAVTTGAEVAEGVLAGAEVAGGVLAMATGVGEVALAVAGVAAIGYGLYKLSGGDSNHSLLDNIANTFSMDNWGF